MHDVIPPSIPKRICYMFLCASLSSFFFYPTSVPISQHEKCPVKSSLSYCCTPAQPATDPVVTLRTGCIMLPVKHVVATATFYM